jgi:4-diphosphocytidyl-2-C-methyl-D-erythritol kinase
VHACAKINLTLRVTGHRADGYHGLRTIFQSIAVHDSLTFRGRRGPFLIECDDSACPTDRTNLVWRTAALVWRAVGRRGEPRDVTVRIAKRIPLQSGLGGGSSDAAAAIRALTRLWRVPLPADVERRIAMRIGADVSFFLAGGTMLGLDRGDLLFPLADLPSRWVTLVLPAFGVSTKDAYGWFDADRAASQRAERSMKAPRPSYLGGHQGVFGSLAPGEHRNDLEAPVTVRHPDIAAIVRALRREGAEHAAMSGSGSAVFGIFALKTHADRAARAMAGAGRRAVVTRTVDRAKYAALCAPT